MNVIFNTTEARSCAEWLRMEGEQLAESKRVLNEAFVKMGNVWSDRKYDAYMVLMTDSLLSLDAFLIQSRRFSAYLEERARRTDAYLQS